MADRSDIMANSPAWGRVSNGLARVIGSERLTGDDELRQLLHDYNQLFSIIIDHLNRNIDATRACADTTVMLDDRVFDSENGIVTKLRAEHRDENKWIVRAVVGGLVSIVVTLIVMIVTLKGS